MLDAAKNALARREALKQVRRREVAPWTEDPAKRRVLVVLPTDQEEAKAAWRFVQSLGVSHRQITPVVPDSTVTYVPVEYIGRVQRLESKELGLIGLPKAALARRVWEDSPDVAFCLLPEPDPASLYLVGAAPAALRVGFHAKNHEPFFDLMVGKSGELPDALASLRQALTRIEPAVFPFEESG